jgi:hypothetical protein
MTYSAAKGYEDEEKKKLISNNEHAVLVQQTCEHTTRKDTH